MRKVRQERFYLIETLALPGSLQVNTGKAVILDIIKEKFLDGVSSL